MCLLEVKDLSVEFATGGKSVRVVNELSFRVGLREVVAVVGESGSGKSMAMLAIMGLLPHSARMSVNSIRFDGREISSLTLRQRRQIVGKEISMIFQEPTTSLNPCFSVGDQIEEMIAAHLDTTRTERRERALNMLHSVGMQNPVQVLSLYPHQMSGGMNQRVMIAMAIACQPKLLIADEPTTALDVTIQKQILDLLVEIQTRNAMSMILITHNLGVVAETADRVIVQYKGNKVEETDVLSLFSAPTHSYTKALLSAMPEMSRSGRLQKVEF